MTSTVGTHAAQHSVNAEHESRRRGFPRRLDCLPTLHPRRRIADRNDTTREHEIDHWTRSVKPPLCSAVLAEGYSGGAGNAERAIARAPRGRLVMFIHGMFMTPHAWDHWTIPFRQRGYSTSAPPWPEHEGAVAVLRRRASSPALGMLTLERVVEHYRAIVSTLREKPVLVGHSMGGLVVQKLLSEGMADGGIAIDSAPPHGVSVLSWPFIRSNRPILKPFAREEDPVMPTFEQFRYSAANRLSPDGARAVYENYIVPESRMVGRGILSEAGALDFGARRGPLLMIAGGHDHLVPAALSRKVFAYHARSPSVTQFRLYAGRGHLTMLEPGWQEVLSHSLRWLEHQGLGARPVVASTGS